MREYQQNLRDWRDKAEIDYFSHFIKAWIPFNSWYQINYPNLNQEKQIMQHIHSQPNVVRSGILPLLDSDSADALDFKNDLARLHERLSYQIIPTKRGILKFEECYIGDNSTKDSNGPNNGCHYTVERDTPALQTAKKRVLCEVKRQTTVLFRLEQTKYDIMEIQSHSDFAKLSVARRSQVEARYREINPDKIVNLLDAANSKPRYRPNGNNFQENQTLEIGAFQFCDHPEWIFSGLVETLYTLRCILFHGEIVPTNAHNEVYEPAYFILRRFLKCIV